MAYEWVILIYLVLGGAPPRLEPVYVSSERFSIDNWNACKARAAEIHDKLPAYLVACVPVHESK